MTICACTDTSSEDTGSSATMKVRLHRYGAGDADALALAARELARIAVHEAGRQPHLVEQFGHPVAPGPIRSAQPEDFQGSEMIWKIERRGDSEP